MCSNRVRCSNYGKSSNSEEALNQRIMKPVVDKRLETGAKAGDTNTAEPLTDAELEVERRYYADVEKGPHVMGPRYIATINALSKRLERVEKLPDEMRNDYCGTPSLCADEVDWQCPVHRAADRLTDALSGNEEAGS